MALLEILQFPDPRLRIKASLVDSIDSQVQDIVMDMYETMYDKKGVGLAATQVGIPYRIFVMDVSDTRDQRICAINPEIISRTGTQYEAEGCLSVAEALDKVERAAAVLLRATNLEGESFELHAEALMAVCIQHEIDHLNGILFIDHLSRLKRDRIRKKIEKHQHRE
jgi:peptide deformylase